MIKEKGYENRSLAIADMIRDGLVEHWQASGEFDAIGTILIAYNPRDVEQAAEPYLNKHRVYVARAERCRELPRDLGCARKSFRDQGHRRPADCGQGRETREAPRRRNSRSELLGGVATLSPRFPSSR